MSYASSSGPQPTSETAVDVDDPEGDDEFYDTEPLPILGRCKALYPFEGRYHFLAETLLRFRGI